MPAILSSLNIVYQYHSGVLFECCFCDDIAFEGEKLTIQKAKTFVNLFLFFLQECM